MPLQQGHLYRFREFAVDPLARTLRRRDEAVDLSRRSFDLLLYLVQNSGKILSKDELLKQIWPDTFVDENSLAKSVSVLRKALDDGTGERSLIVTLPGRGYQFAAPVEIAAPHGEILAPAAENGATFDAAPFDSQSVGVFRERRMIRTSVSEIQQVRPRTSALGWVAVVALVMLMAAGSAYAAYRVWRHFHPVPLSASVVLSEFENTTGDKDFDFALNRAFQIELEQSPFLDILPRSSVRETLTQMQRGADEPLTPELAREVCERNNAQAVLSGSISPFAGKYLLIVNASSCVTGKSVAGYQQQVASKENVLPALDVAAGQLRKQLGESAASLARFQTPIERATTGSLDALRAYTQALAAGDKGDAAAARALFQRAIALDPNFASAYKDFGVAIHNRGDFIQGAALMQKAYDLRAHATEREKLSIETAYNIYHSGDFEAAITSMRLCDAIYPKDASNWFALSKIYSALGQTQQAIEAGEYGYRLDPHSGTGAEVVARAYLRANRLTDAERVAKASIAEGKDRWGMHSILLEIAFIRQDAARVKAEGEWGLTHQQVGLALTDLGFVAASHGKLREAMNDFTGARQEGLRNGDADFADDATMFLAGILWEYGYPREAAASLKMMQSDAIDEGTTAQFRAELGDLAPAQRLIAKINASGTKSTINLYFDEPELSALVALKTHHAAEAVQAIEPARKYQMRDIGVPYQRARAEAEAGMLDKAAEDYRLILDNPGIFPIWPEHTLAHLRLARVLESEKKHEEAQKEYEAFLSMWKDGDGDLPLFIQARAEYEKLKQR